jgi:UDP-glucose 4-epimerase
MDKILVTGGNGFIGRYVVENLKHKGFKPIIFDRYGFKNEDSYVGDIKDFSSINESIGMSDGVIHLAGVLGTAETINEPRPAIDTNIYGSLNVFQACKNYKKRCVYISVGNYWMNNSYSITKDTAERFAWMFNREHGTEIAVVRALNAYGPGQKQKPVRKIIPNFILPALKNEDIIIYGDGSQIMDMIFVEDVADILVRSLIKNHNQYIYNPESGINKSPKFEAGTGVRTSVQEIAELVIKLVGKGRIKNVPMRAGEPENSIVIGNPSTLKPLYDGNIPKLISLEEGLLKTIPYYRSL